MAFNPLGGGLFGGPNFGGTDPQQDAFQRILAQFLKEGRFDQFENQDFLEEAQEDSNPFGDILSNVSFGVEPGGLFRNISEISSLFGRR